MVCVSVLLKEQVRAASPGVSSNVAVVVSVLLMEQVCAASTGLTSSDFILQIASEMLAFRLETVSKHEKLFSLE